ncbi:MAG TPA: DUF998 domain-containing protein [Chitinophagaceae bacterium]
MTSTTYSSSVGQVVNAPYSLVPQKTARLSLYASITVLLLIAALHFIKPELDPSWRMASEYSNGHGGWIMKLAFFIWGLSTISLAIAVKPLLKTMAGRTGRILLFVVAAGTIMAGIFNMDPITISPDQVTTNGNLHGVAAMLGIPILPVAALLVSYGLSRTPSLAHARRQAIRSAHFTWISLAIMFLSIFLMFQETNGKFGPQGMVGWANRLLIIAYCSWLIVLSRQLLKLNSGKSH